MATRPMRRGVVSEFDDAAGLGVIDTPEGGRHPFHCTAIADGSRTIDPGARVLFLVVPGRSGQWEAAGIVEI